MILFLLWNKLLQAKNCCHASQTQTDDLGKTPLDAKKLIVVAAYDEADCFLWGVELKNFAALKELCAQYAPGSAELFQALKEYKLPKKK